MFRLSVAREVIVLAEEVRLEEARNQKIPWKKWGPYVRERQWGTVREVYSEGGDAWNYFTQDQARSRAYLGRRRAWRYFGRVEFRLRDP